jgi:hypothetical protein
MATKADAHSSTVTPIAAIVSQAARSAGAALPVRTFCSFT